MKIPSTKKLVTLTVILLFIISPMSLTEGIVGQPISSQPEHENETTVSQAASHQIAKQTESSYQELENFERNEGLIPIELSEAGTQNKHIFQVYKQPNSGISIDATYTLLTPFEIDGNTEFDNMAISESWPGDGSAVNPYIISGYDINGTDSALPISISNTNVNFSIADNYIHDSSSHGIFFSNVTNGEIKHNFVYNNSRYGIRIEGGSSTTNILENTIFSNGDSGILISQGSFDINIEDNWIYTNNDHGIFTSSSGVNVRILGNIIEDSGDLGIYLVQSQPIQIEQNDVSTSRLYGIYVFRTDSTSIIQNNVHDNGHNGIYLYTGQDHMVNDNVITNNNWDGIQLRRTNNTQIQNNTITQSTASGIANLDNSHGLSVIKNTSFNNSGTGIYNGNVHSSTFERNLLYENKKEGFRLTSGCSNNVIQYNEIFDNSQIGMQLSDSGDNTIQHNLFSSDGVKLDGADLNDYLQTDFNNNTADGLEIVYRENSLGSIPSNFAQLLLINIKDAEITGYDVSGTDVAILIAFSQNLHIHDNTIHDNLAFGMTIAHTNDSNVENNQFLRNAWEGLRVEREAYNNVFQNNEFAHNRHRGIFLEHSDNNLVTNNLSYNNTWTNFVFVNSHNNSLTQNTAHSSVDNPGFTIDRSENNTVIGNAVYNNAKNGIHIIGNSHNSIIEENIVHDNSWSGIYIWRSDNTVVNQNTIYNNSNYGLLVNECDFHLISNNEAYSNQLYGIYTFRSNNNTITNNMAFDNTLNGIAIKISDYNIISHNFGNTNGWDGIALYQGSNYNTVYNNSVYRNTFKGIYLNDASRNNVSYNHIESNDQHGIIVANSPDNTIIENTFEDDGLYILGPSLSRQLQSQVANNTVNGRPLVYIQQKHDGTVVEDAGQVIVIDSSFVIIKNQMLNNVTTGVLARFSHSLSISNNTFANNSNWAVVLINYTNDSFVIGNTFQYNHINATSQAYDSGYNNLFAFNYWDTGSTLDVDNDGISEVPYIIGGDSRNRDMTPLVEPYMDIPEMTSPTILEPNGGEVLNGSITVDWEAVVTLPDHNPQYDLYYSSDGGISWTPIALGVIGITSYVWDTLFVENGENYVIKVIAVNMKTGAVTEDQSDGSFTISNESGRLLQDVPPEWLFGGLGGLLLVLGGGTMVIRRFRG